MGPGAETFGKHRSRTSSFVKVLNPPLSSVSTDAAISRANIAPQTEQVEPPPPRVVHQEFMVEKGLPTEPRTGEQNPAHGQ